MHALSTHLRSPLHSVSFSHLVGSPRSLMLESSLQLAHRQIVHKMGTIWDRFIVTSSLFVGIWLNWSMKSKRSHARGVFSGMFFAFLVITFFSDNSVFFKYLTFPPVCRPPPLLAGECERRPPRRAYVCGEGERRPPRRAYVCGEGGFYTEGVASAASISRLMSK